jgi:hypothetical protein
MYGVPKAFMGLVLLPLVVRATAAEHVTGICVHLLSVLTPIGFVLRHLRRATPHYG